MSGEATLPARETRPEASARVAVDLCVCTHNPRPDMLGRVIEAIAGQTLSAEAFRVLIVDNASAPPLSATILEPLRDRGIAARLVTEPALGVAQARLRAARETNAAWVCFVDDDNVLAPDYVRAGANFIQAHPGVGAFGGRLVLPDEISPPNWLRPFLPFLGIKDLGDRPIVGLADGWREWEPPTAGAFVSRDVVDRYVSAAQSQAEVLALGRKGAQGLGSCEDSFMMRGAFKLGRPLAYCPELTLYHHLDPRRLEFGYLYKLMAGYGESHVMLERLAGAGGAAPRRYVSKRSFVKLLSYVAASEWRKSPQFALAMMGYHMAAWRMHRRLRKGQ